jgi:hypothetical protein
MDFKGGVLGSLVLERLPFQTRKRLGFGSHGSCSPILITSFNSKAPPLKTIKDGAPKVQNCSKPRRPANNREDSLADMTL